MKNILTSTLFLISLFACYSARAQMIEKMHLMPKYITSVYIEPHPEKVRKIITIADSGKYRKYTDTISEKTYTAGKLVKEVQFDKNLRTKVSVYEYKNGHLIKYSSRPRYYNTDKLLNIYSYDKDGNETENDEYEISESGDSLKTVYKSDYVRSKLTRSQAYFRSVAKSETNYFYDNNGLPSKYECDQYLELENSTVEITYKFADSLLTEENSFLVTGYQKTRVGYNQYFYQHRRLVKEVFTPYYHDTTKINTALYEYGANGLIKKVSVTRDTLFCISEYTYKDDLLIRIKARANTRDIMSRGLYFYAGLLTKLPALCETAYSYDEHKNIINVTQFVDGVLESSMSCIIDYN